MTAAYQVRAPEDVQRIAELEEENTFLKRQLALEVDGSAATELALRFGLTAREAALLSLLVESKRTISKGALLDIVSPQADPYGKIIDVFIHKLRKKLGRDAIVTVWGQGVKASPEFIEGLTALGGPL